MLRVAGFTAAGLLALLTLGTLVVVALHAGGTARLIVSDWAAIRFTLTQAVVSAVLSVGIAIPMARALSRRQFVGRGLLITLLGAPFILPVIVAVLGLLAVFGRTGILNQFLGFWGAAPISIYGFSGVVLAHVFFNLPLATRLILQGWGRVPAERFRLAAQLGMGSGAIFRHLEWPMLRTVVPGILVTVFLLCLTSFAVALTLGGGPKATTVELAIYQALRFDFDLPKAALLAMAQFGLFAIAAFVAWSVARPEVRDIALDRPVDRWDSAALSARLGDFLVLSLGAAFLILPLAMISLNGLPHLLDLPQSVFSAAIRSVIVALSAAGLTVFLGLPLAFTIIRSRRVGGLIEASAYLALAASPMVMGTGLFLLLFAWINPAEIALPLTALVNATLSLPFCLRAILPAIRTVEGRYGRLAQSMGVTGFGYFRLILWPNIRPAVGFSAGLTAALSMGDLGVVALFADPDQATLPLVLYRLMSAYKIGAASGAGLLLLGLSLGLFWIFDRGGRLNAAT
jgi:thiamine transport system permease protein